MAELSFPGAPVPGAIVALVAAVARRAVGAAGTVVAEASGLAWWQRFDAALDGVFDDES